VPSESSENFVLLTCYLCTVVLVTFLPSIDLQINSFSDLSQMFTHYTLIPKLGENEMCEIA
jgi:hypothetical protein